MGIKTDKDKRASLRKGVEHSYAHKDDGRGGSDILKLPQGVSFLKWEKDTKYRHIIVAFQAGKNHPLVKTGDFKEGDYLPSVEFHVHKGLGVSGKKSAICMKNTYGKKCAVCDYANELRNKGQDDQANALKPKKQVAYIIYDVKANKKEFNVLSAPHYCFEKGLVEASRTAADNDDEFVDYPYLEKIGAIVKYMIVNSTYKDEKTGRVSNFLKVADGTSFKEITSDDDLPFDFLDKPFCLDDCLVLPDYEAVEKILFSSEDDEDNDDDEDKKSAKGKNEKSEKDEDAPECPNDHTFGKDCDIDDDCDDCKIYNACKKAKKGK